jgi:DNA-binding response OmpR family regulator
VNAKIVGSGIGLLLVKKYVTLLNGQVTFKSQENVGSSFKVIFQVVSTATLTDSDAIEDVSEAVFDEETAESMASKMRILIAEDNEDLCQFLSHALSPDYEVITTENGLLAWEMIQNDMPDLVVSDIMMPKMDGFRLCELIKTNYDTSHIPVILLTALTGKAEQLQGLGLGADDYLTKPFDMEILRQKIKSILLNREIIREKALRQSGGAKFNAIVPNNLNNQFLQRMLEVVRENISNSDFGKEDFASLMNVSTSLLYKKTKALTGLSPTDFIKNVRLEYALELLNTQNYNIAEVSDMSGFASSGYFSTVFKKHYGQSPSEFIKPK